METIPNVLQAAANSNMEREAAYWPPPSMSQSPAVAMTTASAPQHTESEVCSFWLYRVTMVV